MSFGVADVYPTSAPAKEIAKYTPTDYITSAGFPWRFPTEEECSALPVIATSFPFARRYASRSVTSYFTSIPAIAIVAPIRRIHHLSIIADHRRHRWRHK